MSPGVAVDGSSMATNPVRRRLNILSRSRMTPSKNAFSGMIVSSQGSGHSDLKSEIVRSLARSIRSPPRNRRFRPPDPLPVARLLLALGRMVEGRVDVQVCKPAEGYRTKQSDDECLGRLQV